MFHLTEARPMCGAIFSQATSRLLRIALLCRPTPPFRASHARLDPALLQRPAARPTGAPGGRRSGQDEGWERGG
jgi:hypothetical protein